MNNIQHKIKSKKTINRFLYSYVTLGIVIAFSTLIILETIKFIEKKNKIKENTKLIQIEIDRINKKLEKKNSEMVILSTDGGKEEYFRETLPVAGKDEKVFILYNSSTSPVQELSTSTDSKIYEIKRVIEYFINTYTNL